MANILHIKPSWRPTSKNISSSYNIVGFADTTPLFPQVIQFLKEIRKINRDIFTIVGCPLCSPERYIDETGFDLIRLNLQGSNSNNRFIC